MPAKDLYHEQVVKALVKERWTITHDPLRLQWGPKDLYVDLGAEQMIAAEKEGERIAVEIKSFIGPSEIENLRNALGQFVLYRAVMQQVEPERKLYLAVRDVTFLELFEEPIGKLLLNREQVKLIVFDPFAEEIVKWVQSIRTVELSTKFLLSTPRSRMPTATYSAKRSLTGRPTVTCCSRSAGMA